MMRTFLVFGVAAALAMAAAGFRFGDSSHAIGMVSEGGGRANHPFHLSPGFSRYTLVATARVLPPYHGDARINVEGCEPWGWSVYDSRPVVRLPLLHKPEMQDLVFRDLRPKDKLAFWVVLEEGEAEELPGPECSLHMTDLTTGSTVLRIPVSFEHEQEENDHGATS
jgi:hypothetical protein